ncbi:hypothetical protein Cs7R123_09350 [Catellatospora sp. TT07R-123]|uniref:hypothetical protein n=1 Tax=Catellatospora sp. TT07R-123 TaxID=2733863 RepID=UPI001B1DCFEB|nr:hypothetical protein [Catellatospora sp. TT07R-123]GHJ43593.1 hypothetical protein Cs7R123_09350 [Catellatospora sp. TT07R-123]
MDSASLNLLPGEQVLWQGSPIRHRLVWPPDALLIPFSIVWCGFAVFMEASAVADGAPGFFAIWGAMFVAVGGYLVVGRFVVRAVVSRRIRFAVTEHRVIVIGGLTGGRAESTYLDALPPPVISERPDGSGTLAFGAMPSIGDMFSGAMSRRQSWRMWSPHPSATPLLADVPDVRRARDLIAHAQLQSRRGK